MIQIAAEITQRILLTRTHSDNGIVINFNNMDIFVVCFEAVVVQNRSTRPTS